MAPSAMAASGVQHVFFDCDDSLYRNNWATASKLNAKFGAYCSNNFGLPESKMMDLYKTHGTTLCGLIKEGFIKDEKVPAFLDEVHDISLDEDIQPDPELRSLLLKIPHRRWVFTAATREHAVRCLRRMGIEDCFEGIIACSTKEVFDKAGYVSKHDARCFEFAMDAAGVPRHEAGKCMLLDDSASNLKTAKAMGWSTVLVGLRGKNGAEVDQQNADWAVDNIHEIRLAVPQLFTSPEPTLTSDRMMQFQDVFETLTWEDALKPKVSFSKRSRSPELKSSRNVLRRMSSCSTSPGDSPSPVSESDDEVSPRNAVAA
jgi:pyrimidine 5'-nucleotidase